MIRFITKIVLFSIFPIASFWLVLIFDQGRTDSFYRRFTTPRQSALILGNSKAAQGIVPNVLDAELMGLFNVSVYNYSFSVNNSPYGSIYLNSIKRKLNENVRGSYFIVTIDPWGISSYKEDPNDTSIFDENNKFLHEVKKVDLDPNWYYLNGHYKNSFYEIPLQWIKPGPSKLHDNGWFETKREMSENAISYRTGVMVEMFEGYLKEFTFSEARLKYLMETILFLKNYGEVYLVRMPLQRSILQIEERLMGDFDQLMMEFSSDLEVPYIDFTKLERSYEFKDGLHLSSKSAKAFTADLANWIKLHSSSAVTAIPSN